MVWMLSGGASLQREILQGLKVMVGCPLVQGYGQTENAGSALLNSIYDTSSGTTGGVQNTTELKLVDLPEFNYLSTDVNPETGDINYIPVWVIAAAASAAAVTITIFVRRRFSHR